MAVSNRGPARKWFSLTEVIQRAAMRLGADPLAVREVFGAVRHGEVATSANFAKSGAIADDEAAPAWALADLAAPYDARAAAFDFLKQHSAARLYLDFTTGGAPNAAATTAKATIVPWRIQSDGRIVRGEALADVPHRTEVRDPDVAGRVTLYQITAITNDGADAVKLYVAGEGFGYLGTEPG